MVHIHEVLCGVWPVLACSYTLLVSALNQEPHECCARTLALSFTISSFGLFLHDYLREVLTNFCFGAPVLTWFFFLYMCEYTHTRICGCVDTLPCRRHSPLFFEIGFVLVTFSFLWQNNTTKVTFKKGIFNWTHGSTVVPGCQGEQLRARISIHRRR